jgi:arylsulfatase A-like enzyme
MSRMNVLWISTDHQQWQTIAGRSACRTPNIQRLVDAGMLFHRAYAPMPVCCPVRAMWMSGAYPWHNGVHTQVHSAPSLTRDMYPDVVTYSQRLHEAGWRQGFVGKWHASYRRTPLDFGFDELAMPLACGPGTLEGAAVLGPPARPEAAGDLHYHGVRQFRWPGSEPFDMWGYVTGPIEKLRTTQLADCAIDMIRRFSRQPAPWHVALHFPEPHDPYRPHEQYLRRYDPSRLPVPESFYDTFEGKPAMHRRESETWGAFDEADVQAGMAHFFAYCEQIDAQIGRVLDALEACGQAANTLVVFTADHGDMLGAHRMWIKSWMPYEEVYRMPLVIRGPGVRTGTCDHLVQTHDMPHTILDWLGLPGLPHADGRSLRPLLEQADWPQWEDAILCVGYGCEFFVTQRIVITDRYKYVFNGFDYDEMYDLAADPHEMHNRIDDPQLADVRSDLRGRLYALMNRFGDPYGDVGPGAADSDAPNRYGAPRYLPRS